MLQRARSAAAGRFRGHGGVVVAALGVVGVVLVAVDVARDAGEGLALLGVGENALPLAMSVALVATGRWLSTHDRLDADLVAVLCLASVLGVGVLVGWVDVFAAAQGNERPLTRFGYLLVGGAAWGVVIGVYEARRRQQRRRTRHERERLSALFENVPEPAVRLDLTDDEVVVRRVNPAFEETFGYDAADVVGEHLDAFVAPPEEAVTVEALNDRLRAGRTVSREVRRETADGVRTFELTGVPVAGDSGSDSAFVIYRDVTRRNQRRQRLQVLYRVLRHDLRTEMTVLQGRSELLADELADEELDAHVEEILEATESLLELAEQTRSIEQLLGGDRDRTAEPVEEVAASAAESVDRQFECAEAATAVELSAPVKTVEAARPAVAELLDHCLSDGADRATVAVERSDAGKYAELEVRTDEPVLDAAERSVLEGSAEPTQLEHARGLSVWLFYWTMLSSGGSVSASQDDDGTCVTAQLPLAD